MIEARDPRMTASPRSPRLSHLTGVEVLVPSSGHDLALGRLHECTPTAEQRREWDRLHRVPAPTR